MIRYTLKCDKDHSFESWFANAAGYDSLLAAGQVVCAICGSKAIEKAIMAPAIGPKSNQIEDKPLSTPSNPVEEALDAMRKHVEETSEYVGLGFAAQARAMHDGSAPERSIYGEAKLTDAKALIDDGIPVMPLPFSPRRKAN